MKKILSALFILLVMATVAITDSTSFTIHVIGDSTVATYKSSVYPQTGWGQVIGSFFNEGQALINNVAIGGRSSKTFFTDGRLAALKSQVKPGDYLFVQFGHNDRYFGSNARQVPLDSFAYFLKIYLDSAKSWNAIPVLVSPMVMNAWSNGTMRNVFTENGSDYRGVMEKLAKEQDVAFIDLNMRSFEDCKKWGQSYITSFLYHHYDVGDYPNWPEGSNDGTHFQENGSVSNARWIANEISSLSSSTYLSNATKQKLLPLIDALKPHYEVTVKANKNVSGLVTKTAFFPAGAPLTLRVMPNAGENFEYWADAACNKVSTSKIYYGIQAPSGPTTYTAMFTGGAACVPGAVGTSSSSINSSSSSSTPIVSSSSIVESPKILSWVDMANPDSGNGTTDINHEGYTGEGFWNIENVLGSKAYYQLNSKNATTNGVMAIRYANGSTENREMTVSLDGWTYTVSFPPTETWTTWDTLFVEEVWLDAVSMPLVFESMGETGGPNIDALGFSVLDMVRTNSLTSLPKQLSINSSLYKEGIPVQIQLFDALGACLLDQSFTAFDLEHLLRSFAPGVYYIKFIQRGKTFVEQRITKKK